MRSIEVPCKDVAAAQATATATATPTSTSFAEMTPSSAVTATGVRDGDLGTTPGPSTSTTTTSTTLAGPLSSSPVASGSGPSGPGSAPASGPSSGSRLARPFPPGLVSVSASSLAPLSLPSLSSPFSLSSPPPKRKYAPLPPLIQADANLGSCSSFLLTPSPPPSAALPSPATLSSSLSTASSPAEQLQHGDGPDAQQLPLKRLRHARNPSPSVCRRHSTSSMAAAVATSSGTGGHGAARNGPASDNDFLRSSSDETASPPPSPPTPTSGRRGLQPKKDSRWRPSTAKSPRTAGHARRRSPKPLFNAFSRVSRHRDELAGAMRSTTAGGSRQNSHGRRGSLSSSGAAPPPLTREEFEALPVAIQRKYFSTLERLRFAQGATTVNGVYQHYGAVSAQNVQRHHARQDRIVSDNVAAQLRKRSLRLESSSSRSSSLPSPGLGDAVADTLFYASLPDKVKKRAFTQEEQAALAAQLHASVILDAADEAIYKIGRRAGTAHHIFGPDISVDAASLASVRDSMETVRSSSRRDALGLEQPSSGAAKRLSGVPESFYDSFRWLEEEDSLDLRLFLDDYHANLRDTLPSPSKERRPSFRRHLSISKMHFSRPVSASPLSPASPTNASSHRPATKDDVASMRTPTSPSFGGGGGGGGGSLSSNGAVPFPSMAASGGFSPPLSSSGIGGGHVRRKSRTLSLITPKQHAAHAAHASVATIDPGAAHYQDPEARRKLRVYLASPQKFDEAIEFGFPSTEVLSSMALGGPGGPGGSPPVGSSSVLASTTTKGNRNSTAAEKRHERRGTRQMSTSTAAAPRTMRTFLADDDEDENAEGDDDDMAKLDSDQASVPDPESPKTPNLMNAIDVGGGGGGRPKALTDAPGHRPSDSYAQVPASSREMTLRMTLTRLDLRADEDQIYGWQQQQQHHQAPLVLHGRGHSHQQSRHLSLSGGRKPSVTSNVTPTMTNTSPMMTAGTTTTTTATSTCDSTITYLGAGAVSRPKESVEDVFAGIDHWEAEQEKGVMKRFWNRVRRA